MRLAIVSTPRSGNTWLRYILAATYDLQQYDAHRPEDVKWNSLADNCALQIHWRNTPEFAVLLETHRFKVVTLARHPLDTLISILHFAPHEPQTNRWLNGEGGNEATIIGRSPLSRDFLAYATGPRAKALLSVTREWWREPAAAKVRYEDLARAPQATVASLRQALGPADRAIADTLEPFTLEKLRLTSANDHFWQGRPGLWKSLLPMKEAHAVSAAHAALFDELGYRCDPDPNVTHESADRAWQALCGK